MGIFIPFLYILVGYIIGIFSTKISRYISFILINILIPIVVLTTIITYDGAIFQIILISFLFSVLLYYLSSKIYDSLILQVSFGYFNIGWLGLPIGIYFFGYEVAPLIIAAYIGGMLFGSTFCIYLLNSASNNKNISPIKKLLYSPPFLAFILGLVIKFSISTIVLDEWLVDLFIIFKTTMSICGMIILGMWMQKTAITKDNLKKYFSFTIYRLVVGIGLYFLLFGFMVYLDVITKKEFLYLLIIPLLPTAANIVVLETYYLQTSKSAQIIAINTIFSLFILMLFGIIVVPLIL